MCELIYRLNFCRAFSINFNFFKLHKSTEIFFLSVMLLGTADAKPPFTLLMPLSSVSLVRSLRSTDTAAITPGANASEQHVFLVHPLNGAAWKNCIFHRSPMRSSLCIKHRAALNILRTLLFDYRLQNMGCAISGHLRVVFKSPDWLLKL